MKPAIKWLIGLPARAAIFCIRIYQRWIVAGFLAQTAATNRRVVNTRFRRLKSTECLAASYEARGASCGVIRLHAAATIRRDRLLTGRSRENRKCEFCAKASAVKRIRVGLALNSIAWLCLFTRSNSESKCVFQLSLLLSRSH